MEPLPFCPAGLDHVVVRVADAARAREFYEPSSVAPWSATRRISACGSCAPAPR